MPHNKAILLKFKICDWIFSRCKKRYDQSITLFNFSELWSIYLLIRRYQNFFKNNKAIFISSWRLFKFHDSFDPSRKQRKKNIVHGNLCPEILPIMLHFTWRKKFKKILVRYITKKDKWKKQQFTPKRKPKLYLKYKLVAFLIS